MMCVVLCLVVRCVVLLCGFGLLILCLFCACAWLLGVNCVWRLVALIVCLVLYDCFCSAVCAVFVRFVFGPCVWIVTCCAGWGYLLCWRVGCCCAADVFVGWLIALCFCL